MNETSLKVRVYPIDESKGNTKAFVNVVVDDLIAIRGVRVVDSDKGLFVVMPQSLDKKTNEYHDVAFPLSGNLRKELNNIVLEEYDRTANLPPTKRGYDTQDIADSNGKSFDDIKLDIRIYPLNDPNNKTKAFASVSIDDTVAIRGIRIVESEKGKFVAMPQSQDKKTKEYHEVTFPINGDIRKEINKAILNEYKAVEKTADKSLADGLKKGAEKAAGVAANSRDNSARSYDYGHK